MAFSNPFLAASGKASGNPFFPDEEVASSELPLWQRNELMDRLGSATKTTASTLLGTLAVPGSLLYDMATAQPLGSGSTGGDVLDSWGLRPDADTLGGWARPIADFAFEATTDPLNLISFGAGTAARATTAAKAAGLMSDVQRVAGRKLVDDVATGARQIDRLGDMGYANNTRRSFADNFNQGLGNLSDDDLLSRPLVGSRTAARGTRLRDLVESQADQAEAIRKINNSLAKDGQTYADVADDFLYNDIGIRLPKMLGGEFATQLPDWAGGRASAAALDRTGQAIRWSPVGRHAVAASNVFGDNVLGTVREGDQILAKGQVRRDLASDVRARTLINDMSRRMQETAPEIFTNPNLSRAFRNVIEGTADSAQSQLVTNSRLDPLVEQWRQLRRDYIDRSREAGIGSGELDDSYGIDYFPRGVDKEVFRRGQAPVSGGREYSVMTGDQLARADAYSVPGGTDTLNQLSQDAAIHQAATDNDAADLIITQLNSQIQRLNAGRAAEDLLPAYSRQNAVKLARDIRNMNPEAVQRGRGLFDSHPMEDFARYVTGRERAIGRSGLLYDKMANTAQMQNYLDVPQDLGRHNPINQTLQNLDLRTTALPTQGPLPPNAPLTAAQAAIQGPNVQHFPPDQTFGAKQQIVDRLNARLAGTGQQIDIEDLANVSVDAELVARMNRIADFYTVPEVQGMWVDVLDGVTKNWKASVLGWGSTKLRDWYSGIAMNLVEVGHPGMVNAYDAAKHLIQGQSDRLADVVSKMPAYAAEAQVDIAAAIRHYQDDLAIGGLQRGRSLEEFGSTLNSRQTGQGIRNEFVPGSTADTTMGYQAWDAFNMPVTGRAPLGPGSAAYSELGNVAGYRESISRFGQAINPFDNTVPFTDYLNENEIRDPIMRWSARLGDTTDKINRLALYNALMLQGVDSAEAIRRVMKTQIDYGNLTRFEKGAIRRVVPFWTYSSRMGAEVARRIWENPGGPYTQFMLRAPEKFQQMGQEDGDYLPKQIKSNFGLNLEPMRDVPGLGSLVNLLAPPTDGVNSYVADVDLPGTDLINMVQLRRGIDGSPQIGNSLYQTAMGMTSQLLHPALRSGVELLTGRNLHTGKSLTEFEPTTQKLGRAFGVTPFSGLDTALKYSNYAADYIHMHPAYCSRSTDSSMTSAYLTHLPALCRRL